MAESRAVVPPDATATGSRGVRTYQLVRLEADGTWQTIEQQVLAIADSDGNPIDFVAIADAQRQTNELLHDIRALLIGISEHAEGRSISLEDLANYRSELEGPAEEEES